MANKDFNFEEFLTEPKNRLARQGKQHTTRNTRTTSNTNRSTLHPFSVRLDKPYIDKIKAIAWYRKISQREVIELAIDVRSEERRVGKESRARRRVMDDCEESRKEAA